MPSELQKLRQAMGEIDRTRTSTGTRYSTVVEDPFKSGYVRSGNERKRGSRKRAVAILDKVNAAFAKGK
jgi:hypothetical protein